MSAENVIGLAIAVAIALYLIATLVFPERF
jgi:K+-transporting ATPase KdpF subunit